MKIKKINKKYLQHASLMKNATECWRCEFLKVSPKITHTVQVHLQLPIVIALAMKNAPSWEVSELTCNTFTGITIICHQNMMISALPINNLTIDFITLPLKYHISSNKCPMSLMDGWVGGWMNGLELNIFFNNISVIARWWKGDHEVLCNEVPFRFWKNFWTRS